MKTIKERETIIQKRDAELTKFSKTFEGYEKDFNRQRDAIYAKYEKQLEKCM